MLIFEEKQIITAIYNKLEAKTVENNFARMEKRT